MLNLENINDIAEHIGLWRRSKQFFTPDMRRPYEKPLEDAWEKAAPAPLLTNADAMLGKLMLVVTELAEAAEAVRKGDLSNFGEEIADAVIRLLDISDASGINIAYEIGQKMLKNHDRPVKHGKKTNL